VFDEGMWFVIMWIQVVPSHISREDICEFAQEDWLAIPSWGEQQEYSPTWFHKMLSQNSPLYHLFAVLRAL